MFSLFFTPEWFNGWDIAFDTVSLIVALLIAAYSWRVYRISKENKFGYFSFAFILVSLAFAFKMLTTGLLYYANMREVATQILVPLVGRASDGINYSNLFFRSGFFLSMVAMLGAWLLIFFISQKKSGRLRKYYEISQIGLFVYLILLISIVSNFTYFVFYLTSFVILGLVVLNYYKNYLNTNRNRSSFLVLWSFIFILFSNLFFIFVFIYPPFYVIGEVLLLLGFLILLYAYNKVTKRK